MVWDMYDACGRLLLDYNACPGLPAPGLLAQSLPQARFTHPFIRSLIAHLLIHSLALTQSLTHPLIHSPVHLIMHAITHVLACWPSSSLTDSSMA